MIDTHLGRNLLQSTRQQFMRYKDLAEKALAQTRDEDLSRTLDDDSNSIAIILQHLAGNLRSRWTDFLTTDGEKPDRNRDGEFEPRNVSRLLLLASWEDAWQRLVKTIDSLTERDLDRTITIRGQPLTVAEAIHRSLTHAAYHVGQIVLLAKHFRSSEWQSLSIPRSRAGGSAEPSAP